MKPTLRRLAPGSILAGLLWLSISAPLSCANSTQPPPPPPVDAGHKKDASHHHMKACGAIGDPCCAPPTQCDVGAFCAPDGTCKDQHPPDVGHVCFSNNSCSSGICGYTQGISDGSTPVPDGNGTPIPPQSTGCTVGCYNTTPDCTPGWTCQQLTVGEGICVCSWAPEICDSQDNNCDGVIDNEPEADNYCTLMDDGIPQKCVKGACVCVNTCAGSCVDLNNDNANCGKCMHACKPMVEKCEAGACACAYEICGGQCVNTGGNDPMNCGKCGQTCDYTCTQGSCGPSTVASGLSQVGSVAVDSTNVYWIDQSTYIPQVQFCPTTGCTTPSTLAVSGTGGSVAPTAGIAITPTTLYFSNNSTGIEETPLSGGSGTATSFASDASYNTFVVSDGTSLYWTLGGYGYGLTKGVYSCPLGATCASPTLVVNSGSGPNGLAVAGAKVYYATFSGIESAPITGGSPTVACTVTGSYSTPRGLLTAGGNLYFADGTTIYTCPNGSSGAAATAYYLATTSPQTLATDGINLYWNEGGYSYTGGSIQKCALGTTCTTPTPIVSGIARPISIAVGSKDIFWSANGSLGGSVFRYAK